MALGGGVKNCVTCRRESAGWRWPDRFISRHYLPDRLGVCVWLHLLLILKRWGKRRLIEDTITRAYKHLTRAGQRLMQKAEPEVGQALSLSLSLLAAP